MIQELRPKLAKIPGIQVFLQNPPPIRIGGQLTKGQYQFTLQSPEIKELYEYAPKLEAKMRELPGLQDVNSDLQIKNPQVNVEIDRDKASALRVTANQIEDALYSAYGARQISTIYTPINQYQVIIELEPQYQMDPSALSMLYIRSSTGQLVPLNAVANLSRWPWASFSKPPGATPFGNHLFQHQARCFPGGCCNRLLKRQSKATLPATISTSFQGTAQAFQDLHERDGSPIDHGNRSDLHRPRNSLRKFHPSSDHSFGSSFCRVWGFSDPSDFQNGS